MSLKPQATSSRSGPSICAWCKTEIDSGDPTLPTRYGACAKCSVTGNVFPVEDFTQASPQLLDTLPFGIVRLNRHGTVLAYSRTEAAYSGLNPPDVVGKNFFSEVAPCTGVKDFQGRLDALLLKKSSGTASFRFVFKYPTGTVMMSIIMLYDASTDVSTLLIKPEEV